MYVIGGGKGMVKKHVVITLEFICFDHMFSIMYIKYININQ